MPPFVDMAGKRYGKLLVIRATGKNRFGQWLWECHCDCGAVTIAPGSSIRYGTTASCGCGKREVLGNLTRTHGMSKSRTYQCFHSMHKRCSKPGEKSYRFYGGRGIRVCRRWSGPKGFANFLADMGEVPEGMTLERIKVNGNYGPGNCCWATRDEQANNRRSTHFITWKNQKRTITRWASLLGHGSSWLARRLAKYPLDKAMESFNEIKS
jgi:hypothetical protein